MGDNGVCDEMKGESEEELEVAEYLNTESIKRGDSDSSSSNVVPYPVAVAVVDRAAIDRILSEHRSDIIRLGFLRHHHRNSRASTPLIASSSSSSSSPYGRKKGRGIVEAVNEWINSSNNNSGNNNNNNGNNNGNNGNSGNGRDDGDISDTENSKNEDFDMSDEDNDDNNHNTGINTEIGVTSNRTAVKQVSQFLERRLSEIENSKIIQKNNKKKGIKRTNSMKKMTLKPQKNNSDTNISFETAEGRNHGMSRDMTSKSPFWIDNGEEIDENKIYVKFPRIVDKKVEEKEKEREKEREKMDEDAYSLSPRRSRRYFYQNMSSGQRDVGDDSDDDGDVGGGSVGVGVGVGVGGAGGAELRDGVGLGLRAAGSYAVSDDVSMSDSDDEEEEEEDEDG